MEIHLSNQELHEFAQWFSFHFGGGIGGSEEQNKYPREDIIELVDSFIKERPFPKYTKEGFVKWFAEKYQIYGDCTNRDYQEFLKGDIINKKAQTTQEWIDHHFKSGYVTSGLLYRYFQDKIKGDIFKIHYFEDIKKELDDSGIGIII